MLDQTKTAFSLISKFGMPCFSSLEDIEESVSRAQAGGMLNTKELIKISKTLNTFKALKNWKKQYSDKTVIDNLNILLINIRK
jgi:DNA mismatch repair protein MutS2